MPPLPLPTGHLSLTVPVKPLTPSSYAPYGDVIQNPRPALLPGAPPATLSTLPYAAIPANQGSAIKYQHVSRPRDLYAEAPSGIPSQPAMNMFVCRARPLVPAHELRTKDEVGAGQGKSYFPVGILERHPFTTQTFVPLASRARYLVIVAPSLPHPSYPALPTPTMAEGLPGPGLPDLARLEAFVATGDQAVTYGAGTWHAPMAVLGGADEKVDFLVVQFQNGVSVEDVQEVALQSEDAGAGVLVEIGEESLGTADKGARL